MTNDLLSITITITSLPYVRRSQRLVFYEAIAPRGVCGHVYDNNDDDDRRRMQRESGGQMKIRT
jgi:hypothetical protein